MTLNTNCKSIENRLSLFSLIEKLKLLMTTITSKKVLPRDSGMSDTRISFYENTIDKWIVDKSASILVVGGGETDKDVLQRLGFENVIISNLDSRLKGDEFVPYQWSLQKAEELSYGDGEFDFVIVHAALHHCESPHRALLEMYRVAKIAAIAFESRDSLLMRILEKVNLTPSYEHIAVYYNDGKFGGVNNTEIPNYIYRWTERDIEKTVHAYAPFAKHRFQYKYCNDVPSTVGLRQKAATKQLLISIAKPFYKIFIILFPKQQNLFAFFIEKPEVQKNLYEWLRVDGESIRFDYEWAKKVYK
jgi:SAM-dependent methyltransferase